MQRVTMFVLGLITVCLTTMAARADLQLRTQPDRVEIANDQQKVVFSRDLSATISSQATSKTFTITTFVRNGDNWVPMFDGRHPIVGGSVFDDMPDAYTIVRDSKECAQISFHGQHANPKYGWDIAVTATRGSSLINFHFTAHLLNDLKLDNPQPQVAMWMQRPSAMVQIDQGPQTIYGPLGIPHGMGFPAAYLWGDGKEAIVFFNMTPVTWVSPQGVYRFFDMQVASRTLGQVTGLGLFTDKLSGSHIAAGDMVVDFSLFADSRPDKPTKLQALDRMINVCAPLHPANSVFPGNRLQKKEVSWKDFADHAIDDLMVPKDGYWTREANWRDEPLQLAPPVAELVGHPVSVGGDGGDFSSINNHLTPWILFARLSPDPKKLEMALRQVHQLPLFYDPRAGMIRWGTRHPPMLGDMEMSWQNFFYYIETIRADDAVSPKDFDSAVAGRFLMATKGLMELAHNVNYVFPQFFDPYEKQAIVQNDVKKLGKVREPWQVGSYAYIMLSAYQMTKNELYLNEARTSIETLLTKMTYTESNEAYDRTYTDPVDFPITELFGNAYGLVAAQKIYELTGDSRYADYSTDFLNSLLRLTFWYDDRADAICRDLHNAGLFYPHCGATNACPWETSEAHLAIAWALKHNVDPPIRDLLLKLSNLNRINSFYFYPATYTAKIAALDPTRRRDIGQFWPIEPFYTFEGSGGHRGPTAAYMSNNAMWNYWMYEAMAQSNDRTVMVLNTDVLEDYQLAISGTERHLVAFNPTQEVRRFLLCSNSLPNGEYTVRTESAESNGSEEQHFESTRLADGIPITLRPMGSIKVTIVRDGADKARQELNNCRVAQRSLAQAYQNLQEYWSGRVAAEPTHAQQDQADYESAVKAYDAGEFDKASTEARQIIQSRR